MALGKTVGELEEDLGSGELTDWKHYYKIEPFGQERDNLHAAYICTMIANYSGKAKVMKKPDDFMYMNPKVKRDKETARTLQMLDAMAKRNG